MSAITQLDEPGDLFRQVALRPIFDAERETPELLSALQAEVPHIRPIVRALRKAVPLAPSAHVGRVGNCVRLPNHFRSVSFFLPRSGDPERYRGDVVVFKGTEPLLRDFPDYLGWLLRTPFRGSYLPAGLHFSLDMKLPPAAMWLPECIQEQRVTSAVQQQHLKLHGRLARLPVPLFAYEFSAESVGQYADIARRMLPAAAYHRIEAKLANGLAVAAYYYPTLPIRVADLHVSGVKELVQSRVDAHSIVTIVESWVELFAELLKMGYMPYAPWNHGMGSCLDFGNVCIDGGFNDLLTLVPFSAIPGESLFCRSLFASIQMLSDTIVAFCSVTHRMRLGNPLEVTAIGVKFVGCRLEEHIRNVLDSGRRLDPRLERFFIKPSLEMVIDHMREVYRDPQLSMHYYSERSGRPEDVGVTAL